MPLNVNSIGQCISHNDVQNVKMFIHKQHRMKEMHLKIPGRALILDNPNIYSMLWLHCNQYIPTEIQAKCCFIYLKKATVRQAFIYKL